MAEIKISRAETLRAIIKRDGPICRVPGCSKPSVFTEDDPMTIEHVLPKARGGTDDLENLEVAHLSCNGKKGDRIYVGVDENGIRILEERSESHKPKKIVKRPPCETCMEGRLLLFGEKCHVCGSLPQPHRFPKYLQRNPKECNHSSTHCWLCVTGLVERQEVTQNLLIGPE